MRRVRTGVDWSRSRGHWCGPATRRGGGVATRVYVGTRPGRSAEVVVVALVEGRVRILDAALPGLRFEWGKLSCGSLVLAQALLNDATGRPAHGRLLRKFQADVVATIPRERLVLTDAEIRSWLIAGARGSRR